jgi:hypothetical protein
MKKISFILIVIFCPILGLGQKNSKIPYTPVSGYFVKNTYKIDSLRNLKIQTQQEFDSVFSPAAFMGNAGKPTEIDFSRQYVIALIGKESYRNPNFTTIGLTKNKKNEIIFEYQLKESTNQTFTIVPCLLIAVDKKYKNRLVFKLKQN